MSDKYQQLCAQLREKNKDDHRRVESCDGCQDFGLCVLHASSAVRVAPKIEGKYGRR